MTAPWPPALPLPPELANCELQASGRVALPGDTVARGLSSTATPLDPARFAELPPDWVECGLPVDLAASVRLERHRLRPELLRIEPIQAGFVSDSPPLHVDAEGARIFSLERAATVAVTTAVRAIAFHISEGLVEWKLLAPRPTESAFPAPPLDTFVAEITVAPWLLERTNALASSPDGPARLSAAGLIARHWAEAWVESSAKKVSVLLDRGPFVGLRVRDWVGSLSPVAVDSVVNSAVQDAVEWLEDLTSWATSTELDPTEALDLLVRRELLSSLLEAISGLPAAERLAARLTQVDAVAATHLSAFAVVEIPTDPLLDAALADADAWWALATN